MTKDVFLVNLAQIRSAVPEVFHTQSNRQRQKQNLTQFIAWEILWPFCICIFTKCCNAGRSLRRRRSFYGRSI